ncbi:hypothetical protein BDZ89DRAFT_957637 [Hymenopellis radicata]|nr:hypothetical protein BDZ89DRAFT_957637 [Hymenopellis radicata]
MPTYESWNTPVGKATVYRIVTKRIPEWKDGLHERQEEPTLLILDGKELVLCAATGDGKSALFIVPIMCHQEVSKHADEYSNFRVRSQPVGLIITPTKGLASSIVKGLAEYGISGLAYDRETILRAGKERRNLINEITACTLYQVICIDPEHLHAPAWRKILDAPLFRSNLIYACLEEGHVAVEWGQTFREAYNNIGTFLRGRLPSQVPVFSISATLEPGAPTTALCKILGFRANNFTLFRFSNERQDLQFIIEPLEHGITSRSYPQLLPYLNTGRKVIIYAPSLEIVTRIYLYLFRLEPPGVDHGKRVRQYSALCEADFNKETLSLAETDPRLQVIISTVALANGVHIRMLDDSLSVGFPATLSQTEQQAGRASRPPEATGKAVIFVQKSDIKNAKKFLAASTSNPRKKGKKQKKTLLVDPAKAEILTETICLNAARNRRWQNSPISETMKDCIEAKRPFPCSLCCAREDIAITFPSVPEPLYPPFVLPIPKSKRPSLPRALTLKKKERPLVQERLAAFGTKVFEDELYEPGNEYRPESSFFPPSLRTRLTDDILRIHTADLLDAILIAADWSFRIAWKSRLFAEIVDIQYTIGTARPKNTKTQSTRRATGQAQGHGKGKGKARETRRRPWEESSDEDQEDFEEEEHTEDEEEENNAQDDVEDEEEGPEKEPSPPAVIDDTPPASRPSKRVLEDVSNRPRRSVRPRQQDTSGVKTLMAAMGPQRTRRRW